MAAKDYSQDIMEALQIFELDNVPGTIKELNSVFRKLSLKYHPDKNSNSAESTEQFKVLQIHYKRLGDYVLSHIVPNIVGDDEDEKFNRDLFREMFREKNTDKTNTYCHTIIIEKELALLWKPVLDKYLGQHQSKGPHDQYIYKDFQYAINEGTMVHRMPITVTLYATVKEPKIHIQSGSQVHNGHYILFELPQMYQELRKQCSSIISDPSAGQGSQSSCNTRGTKAKPKTIRAKVEKCREILCKFKSRDLKEIEDHKKTHNNKYNARRDLDHIEEEQEIQSTQELEEEVTDPTNMSVSEDADKEVDSEKSKNPEEPEPDSSPQFAFDSTNLLGYNFTSVHQMKMDLDEKNGIVKELQSTISDLEKKNKEMKKEINTLKSNEIKLITDHKVAIEKVASYCNQNTELITKLNTYQKNEVTNMELLRNYNELRKRIDEQAKSTEKENLEEVQVLNAGIQSGFRRETPAAKATPVSKPKTPLHKCTLCAYQTTDENRLKTHREHKHIKCDICSTEFKTPFYLRMHLRDAHHKVNGTMAQCTTCQHSALTAEHLRKHKEIHHKEVKCTKCEHTTKDKYQMREHMFAMHKKNFTCKFWARGNCKNSLCQYKHEPIFCKYGNKCRRTSCHFQHQNTTVNGRNHHLQQNNHQQQDTWRSASSPAEPPSAPWHNPAFSDQMAYNQQFPFLGECQNPCCKRGRGC